MGNGITGNWASSSTYTAPSGLSYSTLLSGYKWTSSTLYYSFPSGSASRANDYSEEGEWSSWYAMSSGNIAVFDAIFDRLEKVVNLTFTKISESSSQAGDIRIAASAAVDASSTAAAWAYQPSSHASGGDMWFASDLAPTTGAYDFQTVVHELGHALGLDHPFDNGNTSFTMGQSVMTYWDKGGGSYNIWPTSFMEEDIRALWYLYGRNLSATSGNDTYSYSGSETKFETLWDSGGTDTFSYSGSLSVQINLTPNSWSRVGAPVYRNSVQVGNVLLIDDGDSTTADFIENATGGSGNDTITGNAVANTLTGGAGNDTLDGGAGQDVAVYSSTRSAYTVTRTGNLTVTVSGPDGTDSLTSVEVLKFSDTSIGGALPSWQTGQSTMTASAGGQSFVVQQVAMSDTVDASRGTLSSRVTVNGADVAGAVSAPTLKKGWKVATVADTDGDSLPEIFFFGVEQVNGVGSGYGATWELNGSGQVGSTKMQLQMSRQGWEVAGAANINGITGDEILWQNSLTGEKAFWTDSNRDGTIDSGVIVSGLGAGSSSERIAGYADLDRDALVEFILYNDSTTAFSVYEATPQSSGSISVALSRSFSSYSDLASAASAAGASHTMFPAIV